MSNFKSDFEVIRTLGEPALLEQLAEECSELAQAALKLARKERGENPTPKTLGECFKDLIAEMADVQLCIWVVEISRGLDLRCHCAWKRERWAKRILEARGETTKETPGEKKKTRQSEFLKMFPNANRDDDVICICPNMICKNVDCDSYAYCKACRKDFWLAEVE